MGLRDRQRRLRRFSTGPRFPINYLGWKGDGKGTVKKNTLLIERDSDLSGESKKLMRQYGAAMDE